MDFLQGNWTANAMQRNCGQNVKWINTAMVRPILTYVCGSCINGLEKLYLRKNKINKRCSEDRRVCQGGGCL